MILYRSDSFQDRFNKLYPHKVEVLALEELAEAAKHDNVCVEFKNFHRKKENFLRSDVLPMDIDNGEHRENSEEIPPESWITTTDIEKIFPDVCFYVVHSKNSEKNKDREMCHDKNWTARPRFHVLFPLAEDVTDESIYSRMKQRARDVCPYFDDNAKDSGRYYDAVDDPKVEFHTGDLYLDEFLASIPDVEKKPSTAPKTAMSYPETDKDELIDALYHIECADLSRHDWIIVGMALKAERIPCDVWDQWSQTDSTRYHDGECARKWETFTGSGVTAGTIFMMARDAGWRPKPKRSKALRWDDTISDDWTPPDDPNVKHQPDKGDDEVKPEPPATATSKTEAVIPPATSEKAPAEVTPPKKRYSLRPDDFSDAGNADIFSREYGDVLRYCDALGWLHWTGKVWERDDHAAIKLATELSERMLKEAKAVHQTASLNVADAAAGMIIDGSAASEEQQARIEKFQDAVSMAEDFLKHARSLRSLTRIKAMVELSIPALMIDVNDLDANPFDLNTPAGIVNLHDGMIRPHDPDAFCTKITAVSPSNDGSAMWFDFLETVTEKDASLEGFLQLVAGAALIGEVKMEAALFFVGSGSNGKSTCTNSWLSVMGDYGGKIDAEILLNTNKNKGPMLATLRSKRLVIASELSESRWLDSAALKTLTSTDEIVGEEKFRQPAAFKPSHTLILCTNNLPHTKARDHGLWRRLICTPFDATITTENAVENFGDVLVRKCGGYILNWMIQGAVSYGRNNYKLTPYPLRVEEITDRYKSDEDWIQRFISDCIEPVEDNEDTPAREVYCVYVDWCKSVGERPKRERDFAAAMKTAGHESTHKHACNVYSGIRAVRDLIPDKYGENW